MTEYEVYGPFNIPIETKHAARRIGSPSDFWLKKEVADLKNRCGVYILGMRAGKGIVPYYVGKTTNEFEKECFQSHKIEKYNDALAEYRKGRPVLFFIARPVKRGQVKKKEIAKIEDFLIQIASAKNNELLNIRGNKKPKWSIEGVVRAKQAPPTMEARKFKSMMNI